MIWKATLVSSAIMVAGFAAVWLRRKASSDQLRFICICTLIACTVAWGFALVPVRWLPEVKTPVEARVPAITIPQIPSRIERLALPTFRSASRLQTAQVVLPEIDWTTVYEAGTASMGVFWLSGWIYAIWLLRRGRRDSIGGRQALLVPRLRVPLCLGWPFRAVLLPAEAGSWDPATLEAILRHEESHIKRCDHTWIGLANLLCALQWFNPLAWLLARQLRMECESVADDAVLNSGVKASTYAELLLSFQSSAPSFPFCPAQPLLRNSGLSRRLEAILSPATQRNPMNKNKSIFAGFAVVAACSLLCGYAFARRTSVFDDSSAVTGVRWITGHPEYSVSRKIQVLQIGVKVGGERVVWYPNGKKVPADRIIDHLWIPDANYGWRVGDPPVHGPSAFRHIVFRVEADPTDVNPDASVDADDAGELGKGFTPMAKRTSYLMTKDGWHYFLDATSIAMSEAAGNKNSVYSAGKLTLSVFAPLTQPVDQGSVGHAPMFSNWTAVPYKGELMGDEMGAKNNKDKNSKVWCKVFYKHPTMMSEEPRFFRKNGSEIPNSLVEGEFIERAPVNHLITGGYYVGVPASEIGDVRVTTKKNADAEFKGIPMSPSGP